VYRISLPVAEVAQSRAHPRFLASWIFERNNHTDVRFCAKDAFLRSFCLRFLISNSLHNCRHENYHKNVYDLNYPYFRRISSPSTPKCNIKKTWDFITRKLRKPLISGQWEIYNRVYFTSIIWTDITLCKFKIEVTVKHMYNSIGKFLIRVRMRKVRMRKGRMQKVRMQKVRVQKVRMQKVRMYEYDKKTGLLCAAYPWRRTTAWVSPSPSPWSSTLSTLGS
jgi:hypothetical protein